MHWETSFLRISHFEKLILSTGIVDYRPTWLVGVNSQVCWSTLAFSFERTVPIHFAV